MEYGILGLLVLILDIVAIVSILQSALSVPMKVLWTLLVLFLPVIGMALWFLIGPRTAIA